ncbi:sugar-binding transcriptional regulator [Intestinibacter sp.]
MKKIIGDTRLMLKCCVMYYENQMGQSEIAKKLGISRPTVSKLIKEAKERGYVRIEIVGPQQQDCYKLERKLEEKFGLKEAIVVEDKYDPVFQKEELGSEVAKYLYRMIQEGDIIGVSMGSTLKMIPKYTKVNKFNKIEFIPLVGGIGEADMTTHSNQLVVELSKGMGGTFKLLHGPAIVSNENIINILIQDKNIQDVFKAMNKMNIAIVGIGSPIDENSNVIKNGYFNNNDIKTFKEKKAAGDICLNVYDINGDVYDYEYNKCVFGMDIQKLRNVDKVIGVACGMEKLNAIMGALNGRYINVLAVNYSLAEALLKFQFR